MLGQGQGHDDGQARRGVCAAQNRRVDTHRLLHVGDAVAVVDVATDMKARVELSQDLAREWSMCDENVHV